ncbi:DUF7947 five-stranded beta-barrel domain-containing protein [Pseudodesulfovibrio portus]
MYRKILELGRCSHNIYALTNKLIIDSDRTQFTGRVSGYSPNTRSGMIYIHEEKRSIPFQIEAGVDVITSVIAKSLLQYDLVKSNILHVYDLFFHIHG